MIALMPVRTAPITLFLFRVLPGTLRISDNGFVRIYDDGAYRQTDLGTMISDDKRQHISDNGSILFTDS